MDNQAELGYGSEDQNVNPENVQNRYQQAIKELYDLAKTACEEIIQFKPELIVVLAHGGWAALWAVEALWEETNSDPLPKGLVLNLGREKLRRYEAIRSSVPCVEIYPFVADYAGDHETGYFLAWLSRQTDWQEMLRGQVSKTLEGKTPERILVLDDTTWEGGTYRLVLGLFKDVYPNCEVRMLAGDLLDWRAYIPNPWLLEHELELQGQEDKEMHNLAYHLAPGTEDIDAENSLDWRQITEESEIIHKLSNYLPTKEWLKLPQWTSAAIREGILVYHQQIHLSKDEEYIRVSAPLLSPNELIIKKLWLNGKITRREVVSLLKISGKGAENLLSRLVERNIVLPKGRGKGSYYVLPPDATFLEEQRPSRPLLDAYWAEPKQLLVGEPINVWDNDVAPRQIEWLLTQGIRCWVNLDGREGTSQKESYEAVLEERSCQFGVITRYIHYPLQPYKTPTKKQVQVLLDKISQVMNSGLPVYLHGRWDELPDAIVGCYLVRKGIIGGKALEDIIELRKNTYEPWRLVPANKKLRRLVRHWE